MFLFIERTNKQECIESYLYTKCGQILISRRVEMYSLTFKKQLLHSSSVSGHNSMENIVLYTKNLLI